MGKKQPAASPQMLAAGKFNINSAIEKVRSQLSPARQEYVAGLENSVSRGDVVAQQAKAATLLSKFWKDSVPVLEPYLFYLSRAALLENSEKSLTFAAQFALDATRNEQVDSVRDWKAETAIELFEKAIALNPKNDSSKVGLGSAYIFGKAMSGTNGEAAMKGVGVLREVLSHDSTNMQAQMMLGIGGFVSGQYDKAIPRLLKVVAAEPNNAEAVNWLADCYAQAGQNQQAIKWYTEGKRLLKDPGYQQEIDARIKQLQQALR